MRSLDREIKKYKELIFVDGYNIINSWENLKSITKKDLEESRRILIDTLTEYKSYTNEGIVLVFDSYNQKGDRQVLIENKLIIIYTRELETADHFIERYAEKYATKKKIRVATSDRLEQDIILAKGATRISALEFQIEVQNFQKEIKRISENEKVKNKLHLGGLDSNIVQELEEYKEKINKK